MLPKDPFLLLSYVNMKLRDEDSSLEEFCSREGVAERTLKDRLAAAGFEYAEGQRQFR